MKTIDIKSVIIGFLSAIVIACGVAATGVDDKWDDKQIWDVEVSTLLGATANDNFSRLKTMGYQPFAWEADTEYVLWRKRIK